MGIGLMIVLDKDRLSIMSKKIFNSKVLLFGEYSIIKESMALSIPYDVFGGELGFKSDKSIDPELRDFSKFLKNLETRKEFDFDFDSFAFDVGRGLFFDSSIPQGYGLGSSGALVASIYSKYTKLIRKDSVFYDISGFNMKFSLFSDTKVESNTFTSILKGGLVVVTPFEYGKKATSKDRFILEKELIEDWESISPIIK